MNNIDDFTVKGHYFFTRDPAPDQWGTGRVAGTLLITAPPGPGPTAVFTTDGRNETVALSGGFTGVQFSDMDCSMVPSSRAPS